MPAPTKCGDVVLLRVDSKPNQYAVCLVRRDGDQFGDDVIVSGHQEALVRARSTVRPGGTVWSILGPDSWYKEALD